MYLILPNLPVWIFEKRMALFPHGYINVECLLVGVLAVFIPRPLTFLLLLFETCAAFVYLVCYTYQFSLSNLFASAHYLFLLPSGHAPVFLLAFLTAVILSALVAFAPPSLRGRARVHVPVVLLSMAFLSIGIDTFDGHNPAMARDDALAIPRVTISPLAELGKRGMMFRYVEASAGSSTNVAMASASAAGIASLRQGTGEEAPNVVLVVVESWGLPHDPALAEAMTAGYQDPELRAKYQVSFGTAPFGGLTVPGEARELCHSYVGFGIMNLSSAQQSGCLPAMFHLHGYQDIAVHGYTGGMFQRERWYKNMGFDQRWFGSDLKRLGLSQCNGAFPGICDGDIAGWIGRSLLADTASQPRFIYWMTLNSHLPVSENVNLPAETNPCPSNQELNNSHPLCSWFRLVLHVHRSVQQIALEDRHRPTVFILVGDHAPPFATPHLRQLFSDSEVPYVILTPREGEAEDDSNIQHGS